MPLHIETRQERSITIIRVIGSILNQDGSSGLLESVQECFKQGRHNLLLEVAQVSGIDQAGVETLRTLQSEAKQAGGDLRLAGARAPFLAELAVNDSEAAFPYYEDIEHALAGYSEYSSKGVKHFDILEFVKEQEKEEQEQATSSSEKSEG